MRNPLVSKGPMVKQRPADCLAKEASGGVYTAEPELSGAVAGLLLEKPPQPFLCRDPRLPPLTVAIDAAGSFCSKENSTEETVLCCW